MLIIVILFLGVIGSMAVFNGVGGTIGAIHMVMNVTAGHIHMIMDIVRGFNIRWEISMEIILLIS